MRVALFREVLAKKLVTAFNSNTIRQARKILATSRYRYQPGVGAFVEQTEDGAESAFTVSR